jgi:hypothetical protein
VNAIVERNMVHARVQMDKHQDETHKTHKIKFS